MICEPETYRINVERLNYHLSRAGEKRLWLAYATGVHPTTLRRWASGKIKRADRSRAVRLAKTLQVPLRSLFDVGDPG